MNFMVIPKQHPFSLYDFIGYFVPGAILLFLIILLDTGKDSICDICDFVKKLAYSCDQSFLHAFSTFIFFFAISYVLGHLISILSNIVIEKSGICRYHNYLSQILLSDNFSDEIKKGSRFFNFLLIYIYFFEYFFTILQRWFPKKTEWKQYIFEEFRHLKPIEETQRKFLKKAIGDILNNTLKLNLDVNSIKIDENKKYIFFEILYHLVIKKDSHHLFKIQNYVALYGFMRNMCMVFCILFWLTLFFLILNILGIVNLTWPTLNIILLFIYSFSGFLTMVGLHKYKKRYTLEVLMAASVIDK